jgi:hypothetical protein
MEILYEHVAGSAPCMPLAIVAWSIAGLISLWTIYEAIKDEDSSYLLILFLTGIIALLGFKSTADTRYNEVVATINENVSWTEVNDRYELLKQEGQLYTFKVKEAPDEAEE